MKTNNYDLEQYLRITATKPENIQKCKYKILDEELLFDTESVCTECRGYDLMCERYKE